MALPYFNNMSIKASYTPVYDNNFVVNFDNEILSDNCFSIEKNIIKFNLFITKNELVPYHIIKEYIENKTLIKYLEISYYNKYGSIEFSFFLKNFLFVEILNLIDFNWENFDSIKKLFVSFRYDKEYVVMYKDYNKFIRKIKLENINENS